MGVFLQIIGGFVMNYEDIITVKKKNEKIEMILNHSVTGEAYILTSPRDWKRKVLNNFNRIYRKEMSIPQLVDLLEKEGVRYLQAKTLVIYPIKECLEYIAKVSNKSLD